MKIRQIRRGSKAVGDANSVRATGRTVLQTQPEVSEPNAGSSCRLISTALPARRAAAVELELSSVW